MFQIVLLKPASDGTQSVVQSDEICSDCFGLIVSIPLPDCWAKFLSDSEKLPFIVQPSLTCQHSADHLRLLFYPDASCPPGPILHPIFEPTLQSIRQWDAGLSV